jgi:ribose 5-phosphate isomerase B
MRIAIASDHAALEMKADLVEWLGEQGHEVADLGPHGRGSVDYPDYGYKLAEAIASGAAERGIALCGSGIGIAIAVNRNPKVRCAQVSEPLSAASPQHNDANAIAMGARLIGPKWPAPASPPSSKPSSKAAATAAASTSSPRPRWTPDT